MTSIHALEEKYERQGWPSLPRPDLKPPEGWSLPLITSVPRIHNHTLSPDGESIAFIWNRGGRSEVHAMPAGGGWPQPVSLGRGPTIYWWDEPAVWSPDGRWLAYGQGEHIYVTATDGGIGRRVSGLAAHATSPLWLPDSNRMIASVELDDAWRLVLTDRQGAFFRLLTPTGADASEPDPAPAGERIVYTHYPHDDLNRLDLKVLDLESGAAYSLTGAPGQKDWNAKWSPDGEQIAFLSQRSGFDEVWLIRPDGSGRRQLTRLGSDIGEFAWSPDGARLVCTVNRNGAYDLAIVAVASGELTYLREGRGYYSSPNWSPRGDFLTVEYEDPALPPDIYRVDVPDGRMTQLTFSNPPALARHSLVMPELVRYRSHDGLEIPAFLYRPPTPNRAAIVYPHGGPASQYGFEWDILAQYFIAKGYTYLAPNYRGSTGYGVSFEHANYNDWGVGDMQDVLLGARYLRELDWIDPDRIGIYGPSYGGYLVACSLARDPDYLFACGVSKYGDANVFSSWAQCRRDVRLYTEMMIGHPARNRRVYAAASPIAEMDNVRKPVLLLHGLDDETVPPQSSEEWAEALRRAGKTFEYKTYADESHGFLKPANLLDAYQRTERFLDWYLLP